MTDCALIEALRAIAGSAAVRTDEAALVFAASDIHVTGETPVAVITPADTAQVSSIVSTATLHGYAIVPRGGGLSYTGGYAAPSAKSIALDMSAMNRILDIADQDLTITVEAGVTWKQIYEALEPSGLRLPFIGTFSGAGATIGGGLSHGALFFGSARYGSAADNVLGIDAVLANGDILRTGQGALAIHSKPILRGFGPDLTGLLTHDGGMFGIKTHATFRLIRMPAAQDFASFAFAEIEQAADALSEIARSDLAEEVYILDPTAISAIDPDASTAVRTAVSVARSAGGTRKAIKALASLARGGSDFIPAGHFSLHLTAAGRAASSVDADIAAATRIATDFGGIQVAPTIPRVARAELFANLNGVLGANGARWAALNAKVAHSDARRLIAAFDRMIAPYAKEMAACGVTFTRLASALGNHCFSFEPVFHWQDSWLPLHRSAPRPGHLSGLTEPPPNEIARNLVNQLRTETVDLFRRLGAASNQIGRTYPFRRALRPAADELLATIKQKLDPTGSINPGVLGYP